MATDLALSIYFYLLFWRHLVLNLFPFRFLMHNYEASSITIDKVWQCREPAIFFHSHHVSLVQWTNPLLPVIRSWVQISWEVLMWNGDSPVSVVSLHWCITAGTFHPIVPLKFRKDIFSHFHNIAHPGRLASRRIISSRFVWHGLSSDVTSWAWSASKARSTATRTWPPNPYPSGSDVFLTFMLIWWACYSTVIISVIFLPSLIAHPSGWKPFPFRYVRGSMRKGFNFYIDFPFWRSRNDHFRSWPAIYFQPLV